MADVILRYRDFRSHWRPGGGSLIDLSHSCLKNRFDCYQSMCQPPPHTLKAASNEECNVSD